MVRITSWTVVAIALWGVAATGCASGNELADNQVSGIVTEVTGDLTGVESFVILDNDGNSHLLRPAPGLLFYGGPLIHLRDHVTTGQRVTVTFESSASGEMTAVLIEHEAS
ncbi:MAG: hypothetical protein M5U23_11355 [Acidimicrobiia bacterium]|nr:hypothetical protein [Acidimicrobiia bacterium]